MLLPNYQNFKRVLEKGKNQLVYKRLPADLDTAVSLMLKLTKNKKNSFLLESVTGGEIKGRYSVIGMDPDLIWECKGKKSRIKIKTNKKFSAFEESKKSPLVKLREILTEIKVDIPKSIPQMAAGLFGFLGYDMIRLVENLPNMNRDVLKLPDAIMIRPQIIVIIDGVKGEIIIVSPVWASKSQNDPKGAYNSAVTKVLKIVKKMQSAVKRPNNYSLPESKRKKPKSNVSKKAYIETVLKAKDYIKKGDIFQVVPSQRWSIPFKLPPFALYRALRRTNPSPYMFYFHLGKYQVVGASPEILVKVKNDKVTIRPIAGTRPRGEDAAEDRLFEDDLLHDKKELAEHLMLLDLGRNDVGRVAKIGTVKVTEQFIVEKYSHVMHIVSNVQGELSDNHDSLSALLSGLPAGTVSGAPKVRAMEIIDELETEKRGVYGGGIGYFGAGGEMDLCIALRTAIIKNDTLYIQAGGGVVADSNPEDEFGETVNKSKALLTAAAQATDFV
ncbi:MAG: anthranilate synthase component I [Rhodobacteraceae bacterium]|nr:MAG: anthranilate synthase component I [Paracoccaceae bacterium]